MVTPLSNEPKHKLEAVLNNELPYPSEPFPGGYIMACRDWFEALSSRHWLVATDIARTYYQGDKAGAEIAANVLPPAPRPD